MNIINQVKQERERKNGKSVYGSDNNEALIDERRTEVHLPFQGHADLRTPKGNPVAVAEVVASIHCLRTSKTVRLPDGEDGLPSQIRIMGESGGIEIIR